MRVYGLIAAAVVAAGSVLFVSADASAQRFGGGMRGGGMFGGGGFRSGGMFRTGGMRGGRMFGGGRGGHMRMGRPGGMREGGMRGPGRHAGGGRVRTTRAGGPRHRGEGMRTPAKRFAKRGGGANRAERRRVARGGEARHARHTTRQTHRSVERRHRGPQRSHGRTVRYAALPAVGVPDVAEPQTEPQYTVPVSDPPPVTQPRPRTRRTESTILGTPNSSYHVREVRHANGTMTRDFVDPATGAIVESRTLDAEGRVTSQTLFDPNTRRRFQVRTFDPETGNLTSIDELHPNGTLAKRTEFRTDGPDGGADQRPARTRYYDANGRMYLDEVHHSGSGVVIVRHVYDPATGKLVRTDYYDLDGNLRFSDHGPGYPQT